MIRKIFIVSLFLIPNLLIAQGNSKICGELLKLEKNYTLNLRSQENNVFQVVVDTEIAQKQFKSLENLGVDIACQIDLENFKLFEICWDEKRLTCTFVTKHMSGSSIDVIGENDVVQ